MIRCKGAKVEIEVTGGDLIQTMIDHDTTPDKAVIACVGLDLTLIFNKLVEIYGIKVASMLWDASHSAYDNVIAKGENEND